MAIITVVLGPKLGKTYRQEVLLKMTVCDQGSFLISFYARFLWETTLETARSGKAAARMDLEGEGRKPEAQRSTDVS